MEFEFDPAKSASNLEKHGIDVGAVQAIWQDVMRVEIPARTEDEPRWLVVGQIDGKHWSVVVTYREQRVRIISARRSRKEEVALRDRGASRPSTTRWWNPAGHAGSIPFARSYCCRAGQATVAVLVRRCWPAPACAVPVVLGSRPCHQDRPPRTFPSHADDQRDD